jgi:hypothetical protein
VRVAPHRSPEEMHGEVSKHRLVGVRRLLGEAGLQQAHRAKQSWAPPNYPVLMGTCDLDTEQAIERERQRIERQRLQRREQIETVAPLVDARVKAWAQADPHRDVGEWRATGRLVETRPFSPGSGKTITAAELARYTVVFAHQLDDEVFAFCDEHQTAFSAGFQGAARDQRPQDWCPGCCNDPTWPPGVRDPAVVAAERAAEREAYQQRIDTIKSSRKNRITKTMQIAVVQGAITERQSEQLMEIWHDIQSPRSEPPGAH